MFFLLIEKIVGVKDKGKLEGGNRLFDFSLWTFFINVYFGKLKERPKLIGW